MITLGLTGPSGAGKGIFGKVAAEYPGVYVIDTDITARKVVQKGTACLNELAQRFGKDILNSDGTLNRPLLAKIAFTDRQNHADLNRITHKYILIDIQSEISVARQKGFRLCIIDAPLLFESGADALCDISLCVTCPYKVRLERIMERDGIDETNAKIRLDSQPKDEFYTSQSTYTLVNDSTLQEFTQKSKDILCRILGS